MARRKGSSPFIYGDDDNIIGVVDAEGDEVRFGGRTVAVAASRTLTREDDGCVLDCTASGLTLTVPASLPQHFGCLIIPNGTTSIASAGGTLLNGATTTVTRAAASNATVAIIQRSGAEGYLVTGS